MASGGLGKLGGIGSKRSVRPLRGAGRPLAIDFGVGSLKILQLDNSDQLKLVAAVQLDTPEELLGDSGKRLRFQMDALPKLVRSGGFKTQRAVCAIPAGAMFCKHLRVHKAEGVGVGELAAAAAARQMNCDPNALLCLHEEIETEGKSGQSEVICMASGRPLVGRLMQTIKHARLEPVGLHSEMHAVLACAAGQAEDSEHASTIYIDLGRGTTKVVIAQGQQMLFARVVEFGGLHIDEIVQQQTGGSITDARSQRLEVTNASREPLHEQTNPAGGEPISATASRIDLSEALEILSDEVKMCLRYHRSVSPDIAVSRMVVMGSEAGHRVLFEHLERELKVASEVFDPFAQIEWTGKEPVSGMSIGVEQPGWVVPVGLCLRPTDL